MTMNSDHVVKNEIQCLKEMARATLNGEPFTQTKYREFCERMNRIENCYSCQEWVIKNYFTLNLQSMIYDK